MKRRWTLLVMALFAAGLGADQPAPKAMPLDKALTKARVDGKHRMLLRQIKVPDDVKKYGEFHDLGPQQKSEWAGYKTLPSGHWVYVFPYWYIWRDVATSQTARRGYGPEQATGPPDTPNPGDQPSAWASASADGNQEWFRAEFLKPVVPAKLKIYENCAPGAVTRVTGYKLDGEEVELWRGKDPTPVGRQHGVSVLTLKADFPIVQVKIHVNSPAVRGWNEIDAVGLEDKAGKTQWAIACAASSTFGARTTVAYRGTVFSSGVAYGGSSQIQKIQQLEADVRKLKAEVAQLKKLKQDVDELKRLKTDIKQLLKDRNRTDEKRNRTGAK